jgi:hypothetical protein
LSSVEELEARRVAEKAHIPDDDPMWLLLMEIRRSCSEAQSCSKTLNETMADVATRIEAAASSSVDEGAINRIFDTAAATILKDERLVTAFAAASKAFQNEATRVVRTFEIQIRDIVRRRASAPATSILFALALGSASAWLSIVATYHLAEAYGQRIGFQSGVQYAGHLGACGR